MKAIETMYAGTLFRSRLEARWAVFFDELNIEWQYEPEGFEIGEREETSPGEWAQPIRYLPDFFLPDTETWVEVKGHEEALDRRLLCRLVDWGQGLPGTEYSLGTKRGLLVLGPIPRPGVLHGHPILQHSKGVFLVRVFFEKGGFNMIGGGGWGEWFGDGYAGCDMATPLLEPLTIEELDDGSASAAYSAARSARFEHSHREVWSKTSR